MKNYTFTLEDFDGEIRSQFTKSFESKAEADSYCFSLEEPSDASWSFEETE